MIAWTASSQDKGIALWNLDTCKQLSTLRENISHKCCIYQCTQSPSFLISAQVPDKRQVFHVWDLHNNQPALKFAVPERIRCFTLTSDGLYCIAGSEQGNLFVWEVPSGALLSVVHAHTRAVTALCLAMDETRIVTGGEDAALHVWSLHSLLASAAETEGVAAPAPRPRTTLAHPLPITALFAYSDVYAVSASQDRTVRIWDVQELRCVASITCPSVVTCGCASHDMRTLFLGTIAGMLLATHVGHHAGQQGALPGDALPPSGSQHAAPSQMSGPGGALPLQLNFRTYHGHTQEITAVALDALQPARVATASMDGTCRVWDVPSAQCLRSVTPHKGQPVTSLVLVTHPGLHLKLQAIGRVPDPLGAQPPMPKRARFLPVAAFQRIRSEDAPVPVRHVSDDPFGAFSDPAVPALAPADFLARSVGPMHSEQIREEWLAFHNEKAAGSPFPVASLRGTAIPVASDEELAAARAETEHWRRIAGVLQSHLTTQLGSAPVGS
eukprot:gnl/Trimastix_PCT/1440.p1 GENE.gnl/Trimastix_PCT/1440~~gnl/Trimastix_PCT/1440.p1  ORF type:complete len:498 (-),score=104.48 gnl/Trimastix_PCT/1440:679-2172(-)